MSTNGPVITYLSLAAFAVGRCSQLDRRLTKPPLSAWWPPFLCFREGESAAVFPSVLPLQRPPPCIPRLAFCKTGGDHWRLWDELVEPGGSCCSSLAVIDGPSGDSWRSSGACV